MHYWMLDVDMDCEQAFGDGQGRRWFELKAFMVTHLMTAVAPMPGWEGRHRPDEQSDAAVLVDQPHGHLRDGQRVRREFPESARRARSELCAVLRAELHLPVAPRRAGASAEMLSSTPCISPNIEKRCLGNVAQTCQTVDGRKVFRTVQDCNCDLGRRELRSDVPEVDRPVLHAGARRQLHRGVLAGRSMRRRRRLRGAARPLSSTGEAPVSESRKPAAAPPNLPGPFPSISASLSPFGCRPSRIASTMSGARQVSGSSRQT